MFDGIKEKRFCRRAAALKNDLYAVAVSILGYSPDTEWAIRNALHSARGKIGELGLLEPVKPWILKILLQECRQMAQLHPEDTEREPGSSLWDAVCALNPDCRAVMVLYYAENLNTAEIAKILDISEESVRRRISQGSAALEQNSGTDKLEKTE